MKPIMLMFVADCKSKFNQADMVADGFVELPLGRAPLSGTSTNYLDEWSRTLSMAVHAGLFGQEIWILLNLCAFACKRCA